MIEGFPGPGFCGADFAGVDVDFFLNGTNFLPMNNPHCVLVTPKGVEPSSPKATDSKSVAFAFRHGATFWFGLCGFVDIEEVVGFFELTRFAESVAPDLRQTLLRER